MDLVQQEHWDAGYKNFSYYIEHDTVTKWIDQYAGPYLNDRKNVFELGCYPGRYLAFLGKKGLTVHGMDLTPAMKDETFNNWFKANGIKTGNLAEGDVLAYAQSTTDQYDVVCSIGFIEHFKNFQEIIRLHDRLLKPGGILIISTPNFRGGVQQALHRLLDVENLRRHYLPSMKPKLWKNTLTELDYNVFFADYFGHFDFWWDQQSRNYLQRFTMKYVRRAVPYLQFLPDSSLQSPYCGIIAQKPLK